MVRFRVTLLTAAVMALMLGACGSSAKVTKSAGADPSTTTGRSPAAQFTGKPLKVDLISIQITATDLRDGLKAAIGAINAAGGIQGHELQLSYCDPGSSANTTAQCARDAVSDPSTLALVNTLAAFDSAVIPIAAQANLPEVGADMSDPSTFNAPGIFPTDMGGLIDSSGAVVLAKDYHARSICLAVIDSPGAAGASAGLINSLYLGPLGMKLAKVVPIPTTATDYSPEVAALKGCDGVQLAIGTDQVTHLLQTAQQLGLDVPMTVATSLYSAQALANFGQLGSKVALLSPFSFASAGYQAFLADMTKFNPGGRTSALAVKSWLTAKLIADAAKSIHGEITRASLSTKLSSLSGYDTQGLTYMPIDYTAKSTIAGGTLSRVFPFMTWVFPYKEANGQPVPMGPAINPFQTR